MAWLKRNLILVIGGVVALLLLGATGYFLFAGYQKNAAVSANLERAANDFTRLNRRTPSATEENIKAAQTEQERLRALVKENWRFFAPFGNYTNVTSAQFKYLLATTLNQLDAMAASQGVMRPRGFAYTFDAQRSLVVFNEDALLPWTYQLLEIKSLCETVYRARVHSLLSIRRASSSTNDVANVVLRGTVSTTNTAAGAVTTPYEVVFQGFTTELAEVLGGLARSPHCFLVKNINVEESRQPAVSSGGGSPDWMSNRYGPSAAAPAARPGSSMADRYGVQSPASRYGATGAAAARAAAERQSRSQMASRYGTSPGGGRGVPMRPTRPTYTPQYNYGTSPRIAARKGPETAVDEHLLKFTLRLDAVRPLMAAK